MPVRSDCSPSRCAKRARWCRRGSAQAHRASTLPPAAFESAVAALVLSHHRLAELYRRDGDAAEVETHLWNAHEVVRSLLADAQLDARWQAAARRQWKRTHGALLMLVENQTVGSRAHELLYGGH